MTMTVTTYVNNNISSKLNTASPNNTVNVVDEITIGGTTNVGVAIVPKGTGAFSLAVPDGTAVGGNVRGANSVDLQTARSAATQVASGQWCLVGGKNSKASYWTDLAFGDECTASGGWSIALGRDASASANMAVSIGYANVASGTSSLAVNDSNYASGGKSFASGHWAVADRAAMRAHASYAFAAPGDAQYVRHVLFKKTTDATPSTLLIGGTTRLTIPTGKIMFADILISGILSTGASACCYKRKVAIKNVGGTTALVGTVETIGTDIEDNAACDVAITADDTNDALQINVTGIAAETWRWVAVVEGLEIAYGT